MLNVQPEDQVRSDFVSVPSGDANSIVAVLSLRDEETLRPADLSVEYSAGGTASGVAVEFHDVDEAESVGNTSVDDAIDVTEVSPGDRLSLDDLVEEDVENDVCVVIDRGGSAGVDGDMYVRASGVLVTS